MSNRIDQLFKEKLSDHKVAPSPEAWTKVQSGLLKKNNIIVVWKMAAGFVLFGALISAWYFLSNDETITPTQLAEKKEIVTPQKEVIEKPVESIRESEKANITQTPKPEDRKRRNEKSEIKKQIENYTTENITMEDELQKQVEDNLIVTESALIVHSVNKEKPIVIEFTLESISKEPIMEVVQTSEAESSGLKKILETALDVKNGDSDLGIIRDAKNQLFALEFKKDKTKRN